jgi:hypothetical protein
MWREPLRECLQFLNQPFMLINGIGETFLGRNSKNFEKPFRGEILQIRLKGFLFFIQISFRDF